MSNNQPIVAYMVNEVESFYLQPDSQGVIQFRDDRLPYVWLKLVPIESPHPVIGDSVSYMMHVLFYGCPLTFSEPVPITLHRSSVQGVVETVHDMFGEDFCYFRNLDDIDWTEWDPEGDQVLHDEVPGPTSNDLIWEFPIDTVGRQLLAMTLRALDAWKVILIEGVWVREQEPFLELG